MKRKTTSASEHLGAAETPQPDKLPDHPKPNIAAGFPIVGIGASAGGLAAFEAFFTGLPAATDPGMAFVLVQHLAPDHKSILRFTPAASSITERSITPCLFNLH